MSIDHLGPLLRYHRERASLSRRALSELCGVSETAIYDAESSKPAAKLSTLRSLAAALNLTFSVDGPLAGDFLSERQKDRGGE